MLNQTHWKKPDSDAAGSAAEQVIEELTSLFLSRKREPHPHSKLLPTREQTDPSLEQLNLTARYQTLVEQIPAIVFMAYLDDGIGEAYVSPHIEAVLGYTREEWLDDPVRWFQQIHPEDKARWSIEAANMFLTGQPLRSVYRVMSRSGKVVWFQCDAKMVHKEDGVPWFIHGVAIDVTELKEADEALKKAHDELEMRVRERTTELARVNRDLQFEIAERERAEGERALLLQREKEARREAEAANRLKDEFLAIVSHELRSPLNVVVGHSSILLRSEEAKQSQLVRRAAEAINRNALAQAQLVSDLLDLSRLRMGKLALDSQPVSLSPIISEAVDTVRADAKAKDISLHISLPTDPLLVYGDALRLRQIFWNLLSNAVKFTPAGGRVEITLDQVMDQARLIIADSGQGIDSEFLPYIFEMFRQADAGTTRQHGGMGIGLALVHQLVQLHHGNVEAASAGPGHGAQFIIELPLDHETLESGRSVANIGGENLANIRVLVVDDSEDSLDALSKLLRMEGAIVETASSGAEALSIVNEKRFDVLLSDISMPEMDGFGLLRHLRRLTNSARLPAVALTGFGRTEDVDRAKAEGFIAHITKPIDFQKLIDVVRKASRRRLLPGA
jgi:PAS domain S-box-containing protein